MYFSHDADSCQEVLGEFMIWIYSVFLLIICFIFQQLISNELLASTANEKGERAKFQDILAYLSLTPHQLQNFEIPHYKFFSEIIAKLLKFRAKYGCELNSILKEIKKAIVKDKALAKKIFAIKKQAILQIALIIIVTLSFHILACTFILDIPMDFAFLLKFVIWNLVGMGLFIAVIFFIEKKLLKGFEQFFAALYIVKSLLSISRPMNEVIQNSQLLECPSCKSYSPVLKTAKQQIECIKKYGSYDLENWDMLIQELWDIYDEQMERYKKHVKVVMAIVLLSFALPSYLLSILNLIENLSLMS